MRFIVAAAALSLVASAGLVACSSSSEESTPSAAASPAASASMVGGTATCDDASLSQAIQDVLDANGDGETLFSLDGLECADGWAATFPTIGTTEDNAVTETWVFEAEGQFWIQRDRNDVCGTQDANDSQAYPADAQVPEPIYQDACNTN